MIIAFLMIIGGTFIATNNNYRTSAKLVKGAKHTILFQFNITLFKKGLRCETRPFLYVIADAGY